MVQPKENAGYPTNAVCNLIREQLYEIERKHDVTVLLAIEHGSRAWGYSSESSDYDVKFIYRHNEDNYKNIYDPTQFITVKSDCGNYDLNGWDLKKTLLLIRKGNAQVYEFLESPVRYIYMEQVNHLGRFAREEAMKLFDTVTYHYYALAKRTYEERVRDVGEPTLKKYFYIIRPLLCTEYMQSQKKLPILQFQPLLEETRNGLISPEIYDTVQELLSLKRAGKIPKEVIQRVEHLDSWIESRLVFWKEKLAKEVNYPDMAPYDAMFKLLAFHK